MSTDLSDSAFVRFVNLMRAISGLPAGVSLDPQEERLLQELALRWGRGEDVTVLSAMNTMADASPSTVQRRLKSLRSKGLVSIEPAAHDARVRHVVPTAEGQAYFSHMSELMQRAVRRC